MLPYVSFAPLLIAQEEGYFAEQQLHVTFRKLKRSADAIVALARGEIDVAGGTISLAFLNGLARGARIRLVADKGYIDPAGCTYTAVMARRALVEAGAPDTAGWLRGRRVAVNRHSFQGYLLDKLLESAGLGLEAIEVADVPDAALPGALSQGAIDLAVTSEPWITHILRSGHGVIWKRVEDVAPGAQYAFIAYGPTLLDRNPDAGRRFLVAYLEGVSVYNRGKTKRILQILEKQTGLPTEVLEASCWPRIRADGRIDVHSVLEFQRWAARRNLLDRLIDPGEFWDPRFADHASGVLASPTR